MARLGILLVNLGTPDAPTIHAVRRYLAEFLSDSRVVEQPRWIWWLILNFIILPIRSRKSAKLYQKIWTDKGSPLKYYSQMLSERLEQRLPEDVIVVLGMRYGHPSIEHALNQLKEAKVEKIIVWPLYPQYSATTSATTFDCIVDVLKTWRNIPSIHFVRSYYAENVYIEALAAQVNAFWGKHGRAEKLIFSFHGLPLRYVEQGDPYYQECLSTASLLATKLQLSSDQWQVAFQSRLGIEKWLSPYLDEVLSSLPKQGIHSVQVFCPGFAVDCLETLEEVAMLNRDRFLNSGGKQFQYIPALNDNDIHVAMLQGLLKITL